MGKPLPMPYAYVLIGERFGLAPWDIEDAPADRVQFYLNLLGAEGEFKGDLAGLEPHEPMYWEDE